MPKLTLEDIVIIGVVIFGLIGGFLIFIFFPNAVPPIFTAIFIGLGVASLVYRFLGGISQGSSFLINGVKVAGPLGALLFCIWFFNYYLVKQGP